MKPITGKAVPSIRLSVCVCVCAYLCVSVCVCACSYFSVPVPPIVGLTVHQQENMSHLHTDAHSPSVNDDGPEVVVGAGRTVKRSRWSSYQLSEWCSETHALNDVELLCFPFLHQQAAQWSPPEQAEIAFMQKYFIRSSWGTSRMPKHCSNTFRRPSKI